MAVLQNYTSAELSDAPVPPRIEPFLGVEGHIFFYITFTPPAKILQFFSCCFSILVLFSLSWFSSLFALFSPSSLSSPSVLGLVIGSYQGSTSSPPPAGGRLSRCWLHAWGCSVCGAAPPSLHTCLCTSPRATTLTPRSPGGYLGVQGVLLHHYTRLDWKIFSGTHSYILSTDNYFSSTFFLVVCKVWDKILLTRRWRDLWEVVINRQSSGIKGRNPSRFLAPLCCLLMGRHGNRLEVCDAKSNFSHPEHWCWLL